LTQDTEPERCAHAVYTIDGGTISDPQGHVNFIVRLLYCVVLYFIAQLSMSYGVRVDLDRFFSAFSMIVGEDRIQIEPWTLGPGYRRREALGSTPVGKIIDNAEYVDQEPMRKDINNLWMAYEVHAAGHIPWVVCTNRYPALIGAEPTTDEENVTIGML